MANSVIKKAAAAFTGAKSSLLGSEMPETPGMKLTPGKISTATRRKFVATGAVEAEE